MKRIYLIVSASVPFLLLYVASEAFEIRTNRVIRRKGHSRHKSVRRPSQFSLGNCISGEEDCNDFSGGGYAKAKPSLNATLDKMIAEGVEVDSKGRSVAKSRARRGTYAWPEGSLFIADFSLEIPLYSPASVSVPLLLEIQYTFDLPNVTESIVTARNSKNQRSSVLGTIESLFSRFGFEGRGCVLRAICEKAENKIISGGLLGEVLNLLLIMPTTGDEGEGFVSLEQYRMAEHHGRTLGNCASRYSTCSMSIFHFFD